MSKRVLLGRFCCITNSMFGICAWALCMWPDHTMVSTFRQASRPPRAATFFSTILAADSSAAQPFEVRVATVIPAANIATSFQRIGRFSRFGAGEHRIVQHRIQTDFFDDHLVRVLVPVDSGLEDEGHLQP